MDADPNTTSPDTTSAPVRFADLTTLGVGGPARNYREATTQDELIAAVQAADDQRAPLLLIGGGSNLVVADAGFEGAAVRIATRGVEIVDDTGCGGVTVRVQAGEPWDAFVERAVGSGWIGIEALSGIPGSVGATPIQNVGAYGQDVAHTIAQVRTYDRSERAIRTFAAGDCGFGYRTSVFKSTGDRYVVLDVTFQFSEGELGLPLRYAELARALNVEVEERATMTAVRDAVLALRRGKGMVLDPADDDTRSAGSFFLNPLLAADVAQHLPADAPRWPQPDGRVKASAAWLIEQSGFAKGFALDDRATARISTKHTLALTTTPPTDRREATAADVIALARVIRHGVRERFGITLQAEPRLVGLTLDDAADRDDVADRDDAAPQNNEVPE